MATIEEKIKKIMENNPITRDNDADLYCEYSLTFGGPYFTETQKNWMRKNPFETVSRARRKVQEINKELRSDYDIEIQRELKEREFKEKYGTARNFFQSIQQKIKEK